jgi:hypothetical protein
MLKSAKSGKRSGVCGKHSEEKKRHIEIWWVKLDEEHHAEKLGVVGRIK